MYENSRTHLTEGLAPDTQSEACEHCLKLGSKLYNCTN